jgi:outer membrane receptor protein involved in Fe transport
MKGLRKLKRLSPTLVFMMIAALVIPLTSLPAMAQATTGGLRGVVSDQSGGVIAEADVIARHTATGVETKTKTNSEGIYNLPRLSPGKYLLTVEKQGFKKQKFEEVIVNIGQDITLDAALEAGRVDEIVTVTAGSENLIQREQVQVSNSFESRKVSELPTNAAGGGIDTLALLAPGVVPGFGNVNGNGTTLSVNGQRARSNNFTVDGQDNNDLSIGGPNFFVTNNDAVGEFQIITNNYSAEYGRNQGGIVNIVTKSGTNDYHGTAGWFHRNQSLFDSLNNLERRTDNNGKGEPDPLINNVFSGTIGGPVKKDRLWFFGAFQYATVRTETLFQAFNPAIASEEIARLKAAFPSNPVVQAMADFSSFAITDVSIPFERTDLPQNETVTIGGQTFRVAYPQRLVRQPVDSPELTLRGDYQINDRHGFWYRHLYRSADNKNGLAGSGGFVGDIPTHANLSGGQWTAQFSDTAVNEFRFVFNRLDLVFGGGCENFKGCITAPENVGDSLTNLRFAGFTSSGGTSLQGIGPATNLPQDRIVTVYQWTDNFSKIMGRHQMKMGADIRRLTNAVSFLPFINSRFSYNSATRVLNNTPSSIDLAGGQYKIAYTETDQFYYFQDDWRVKDNLTFNLGIRYEYTGQPINTLNSLTVARESNSQTALWRQNLPLEVRTFPKLGADKTNWAPRVGLAWRPRLGDGRLSRWLLGQSDSAVISAGYSVAYDPSFYNLLLNASTSAPTAFLLNIPAAATFGLPPGTPTGANVAAAAEAAGALQRNAYDPRFFTQTRFSGDFYSPYVQQWTVRAQREITSKNVVEVRYVGSKTTGLFQTLNGNPRIDRLINGFSLGGFTFPGFPNFVPAGLRPQVAGQGQCVNDPATPINEANLCNGRALPFGQIRSRENTATASYHGLQTRYDGRLLNQFQLGLSYTWSKALDNASEVFSFFESAVPQDPFNRNAGEKSFSGFDRNHALAMNFIWDAPFYKDQKGVIGKALGGWQLTGTYFLASGQRFTPSQACGALCLGIGYNDTAFDGFFLGQDSIRPFLGNPNAAKNTVGISQIDAALLFGVAVEDDRGFYNFVELNNSNGANAVSIKSTDAFLIYNGPGAASIFGTPYGNAPRGLLRGPRLNDLALGVFKNTRIDENIRLQFRLDIFNALNHPNPGVGFNAGAATPGGFVEGTYVGLPFNDNGEVALARRALQFGLKVIF